MDVDAAITEWRGLLGSAQVLTSDQAQQTYGMDCGGLARRIGAALRITDSAQLPEVMRIASRHKAPVYPISTGRNWGYGTSLPVVDGCTIIDLSALQRILHFDTELGVVTVEPGVTQGMLADYLVRGGHAFMVPTTGAGPNCSLVGNALERGYGITPHADHFGAVTDIEAVLADGNIYRTALRELGGEDLARLFKWGIGPYSAGLFTQSGFGIVTRMSILVARRPQAIRACLFSLRSDELLEPAVARVRSILASLPGIVGGVNLMNRHRILAMSAPYPLGQLGPDGLIPEALIERMGRQYQVQPWTGFATLYGTRRVLAAAQRDIKSQLRGIANRLVFVSPSSASRISRLAGHLPGAIGRRLAGTAATLASSLELIAGQPNETAMPLAYWRHPQPPAGAQRNPSRDGCGLIWYAPLVPMRPTAVSEFVDMARRVTAEHRLEPLITLTSVGERLFDSTIPLLFERSDQEATAAALRCRDSLVAAGRGLGCFPYRLGIDAMHWLAGTDADRVRQSLQQTIDPDSIIAPGRYGAAR